MMLVSIFFLCLMVPQRVMWSAAKVRPLSPSLAPEGAVLQLLQGILRPDLDLCVRAESTIHRATHAPKQHEKQCSNYFVTQDYSKCFVLSYLNCFLSSPI